MAKTAILKDAFTSHSGGVAPSDADGMMRNRGEKVLCGAGTLAGWSDAANGDRTDEGRSRLGYVIRLASSTLRGHQRRTSTFTGKMEKVAGGRGGGGVCLQWNEFFAPCADAPRGMVRTGDCERPFSHLRNKKNLMCSGERIFDSGHRKPRGWPHQGEK